jgi:hypothetical protein
MPSPGHTTLIRLPNGNWNVDSFFDIEYRIDFVGAPGGPLSGRAGSTTGTIRMGPASPRRASCPSRRRRGGPPWSAANPFNPSTEVHFVPSRPAGRLTVYDGIGRRPPLANERFEAGDHGVTWDGRDDAGREMGSGSYFFHLTVDGQFVGTQKAVILK